MAVIIGLIAYLLFCILLISYNNFVKHGFCISGKTLLDQVINLKTGWWATILIFQTRPHLTVHCSTYAEEIKFIDYKNLRDVELHKYRYCCSPGKQLILHADAIQTIQPRAKRNVAAGTPEVTIRHPDVEQVESIIRASWTTVKYPNHWTVKNW